MDGNYQNEKLNYDEVKQWLLESIERITVTGNAMDTHVDNFIETSNLKKSELILESILLFQVFANVFKEIKHDSLSLYLSIELVTQGPALVGAPRSYSQLCSQFDNYTAPEIILYRPSIASYSPFVEIYRKPLFFDDLLRFNEINFFYKEDRILDANNKGSDFKRELIGVFAG